MHAELFCEFHGEFIIMIIAYGESDGEGNGSVLHGLVSGSRSWLLGVGVRAAAARHLPPPPPPPPPPIAGKLLRNVFWGV